MKKSLYTVMIMTVLSLNGCSVNEESTGAVKFSPSEVILSEDDREWVEVIAEAAPGTRYCLKYSDEMLAARGIEFDRSYHDYVKGTCRILVRATGEGEWKVTDQRIWAVSEKDISKGRELGCFDISFR